MVPNVATNKRVLVMESEAVRREAVGCIDWLDAEVTNSLVHVYRRGGNIAEIHLRSDNWFRPAPNRRGFIVSPNTNPELIFGNVHNVPYDELGAFAEITGRKAHVNVAAPSIPLACYIRWLPIVIEGHESPISPEFIITTPSSRVYACPSASKVRFSDSSVVTLVGVDDRGKRKQTEQHRQNNEFLLSSRPSV
jgi:hypothetical protein